jgi:SAM-dependent methyltransferase
MAANRYAELAQAFDAIAPGYDQSYGPDNSRVMGWYRAENLALLHATFPPQATLLEIGCGTGEEALHLAQAGHRITATDISPRMVAITRQKVKAAGLGERISALKMAAGRVGDLDRPAQFDGAYASFGCLNCEPDLPALAEALANLLKPGGLFVCSVMARLSPFEILWFIAHRQPRRAKRRLKHGWQMASVTVAGGGSDAVDVPTRYLSKRELATAFSPHLTLKQSRAVGLLVPPPYLEVTYRRWPSFWRRMALVERRLRDQWPWRGMGDHLSLVFKKR